MNKKNKKIILATNYYVIHPSTHRHIKDSSSPITKYLSNRFSLSFLLSSYHHHAFGPSPFFPTIPPASFSSSFTRLRSFRIADIIGSQEKAWRSNATVGIPKGGGRTSEVMSFKGIGPPSIKIPLVPGKSHRLFIFETVYKTWSKPAPSC